MKLSKEKKFKKYHRFIYCNKEYYKANISGYYSIRAAQFGKISFKGFETIIKVIKYCGRLQEKKINFWFPKIADINFTLKAKGLRMGRGKGSVSFKCAVFKPGQIILEIDHIYYLIAYKCLYLCQKKVAMRTLIVFNNI